MVQIWKTLAAFLLMDFILCPILAFGPHDCIRIQLDCFHVLGSEMRICWSPTLYAWALKPYQFANISAHFVHGSGRSEIDGILQEKKNLAFNSLTHISENNL